MEKFTKITTGFVTQSYEINAAGKFICTKQEFIAGDDVQFEDLKGDSIEASEHEYQPFNMSLVSSSQIIDRLGDVLTSIDVGGEKSRQFADEIAYLNSAIKEAKL